MLCEGTLFGVLLEGKPIEIVLLGGQGKLEYDVYGSGVVVVESIVDVRRRPGWLCDERNPHLSEVERVIEYQRTAQTTTIAGGLLA